MDPRELLVANLALIERVIAHTCHRHRLTQDDADDFGSVVKLKLVENDYGIIRKFEGRASFSTFIAVVVQRMLLDYRIHLWGKWHPSAEAKRLGERAVELERHMLRDNRSLDEAVALVQGADPSVTRAVAAEWATRFPPRAPKRRDVALEEAESVTVDAATDSAEQSRTSARVSAAMRRVLETLPAEDRLVLQLRFEEGMTVAQIARSLQLDQKQLYRRIEKRLEEGRNALLAAGFEADEIRDLIGAHGVLLDFSLRNRDGSPSLTHETTIASGKEELSR